MKGVDYPENIEEIRKFAEEIKLDVKYLLGEKYEGSLRCDNNSVSVIPDNLVFNTTGNLYLTSIETLPNNIVFNIGGHLFLLKLTNIPENIVFNVGYAVIIPMVESIPASVQFNIGGRLILSIEPSDNHKVKIKWA